MGTLQKFACPRRVLQSFASLNNKKGIKDYSSSTKANLNEVEEWILVMQKSENIQIIINMNESKFM